MTVDELISLLESLERTPGEKVGLSELDHGLQCAYELECAHPADLELQVAGLLHDIGHGYASDEEHGRAGGERVRSAFGDRVASIVEGHVPAKRYLVATDASYGDGLSEVSVTSLRLQGGPMSAEEVSEFEAQPFSSDAIALRRADDRAKAPGRSVPGLDHWVPVMRQVAR